MGKSPLLLLAAFLIAAGAAWYLARSSAPIHDTVSEPLAPVLKEAINSVRKLRVLGPGGDDVLLEGYGNEWKVANRGDYPALFGKVRSLIINLSEARIVEYKTSNPELYDRLGLEPVEEEGANSHQVVIEDGTGKVMLDLIVGDESTGAISGYYARYGDKEQSFLVDGDLAVDAIMRNWLDAELANIDADRIKEISIRPGGEQPLRIYREELDQRDFSIADIPEGQEVTSQTTLNRMGTILASLSAEDVLSKDDFSFSEAAINTRVLTYNGLVADITAEYVDGKAYATIAFSEDEDGIRKSAEEEGEDYGPEDIDNILESVRNEAASLNGKFEGWLYEVPYFKYDMFDRKPGGLLSEAGDEPADGGGDEAAAPSP